jgi:hypothetical protein
MNAPVRYAYTDAELERANRVGDARQEFHEARGTGDAHGFRGDGRLVNRQGALAELVVASWLGVADQWIELVDEFRDVPGDVLPGVDVRYNSRSTGDLLLRDRDKPERLYVLVRPHRARSLELSGWIRGADGLHAIWRTDLHNGRPPCYLIPATELRSMPLLAEHLDLVPAGPNTEQEPAR